MSEDQERLAHEIGKEVRWRRQKAGLSQEGLARLAGTSLQTIYRVEAARHLADWDTLERIAVAFDVPLLVLVCRGEASTPSPASEAPQARDPGSPASPPGP